MELEFGPFSFDTKGLPPVSKVFFHSAKKQVAIYLSNPRGTQNCVERWAKRFGVQAIDIKGVYNDWQWAEATVEKDGFTLIISTFVFAPAANAAALDSGAANSQ